MTAYDVCVRELRQRWVGDKTPEQVVAIMFDALDRVRDRTVPRDADARHDAIIMAGMVFADLDGEDGVDYGALTNNVLRAAGRVGA